VGRTVAMVAVVVGLAACGAEGPSAELPPSTPATGEAPVAVSTMDDVPSTLVASTASTPVSSTAPVKTVDVTVTGVVGWNPDGTAELCPYADVCFGILLASDVDSLLEGRWAEAVGTFDGRQLELSGDVREVDAPPLMSFGPLPPRCPPLASSSLPGPEATAAAERYLDTVRDVFAGAWLDDTGVMTYWFVGDDVDAHQAALAGAFGDASVCVVGGARWSRVQLADVAEEIFVDWGVAHMRLAGGVDEIDNVVDVHARLLDSDLRRSMERYGENVRVTAYIEIVNATIDDFPGIAPVVDGDLALLTQRDGGRNGEEAGVAFTLRYDEQLSCVYGEAEGFDGARHRVLPVWPDGYTAMTDPVTVYDFDGLPVAVEGERYAGGGGYHDPAALDRWSDHDGTCGVEQSDAMVVITR
jgi:predicted small lipoprotein YifL